jgi:hypothetical protein
MVQCLICYETRSNLIFLHCLHSLCKCCLNKLEPRICPFCRKEISDDIGESFRDNIVKYNTICIKMRTRKHNFRSETEILDVNGKTIIVKTFYRNRRHKKS